MITIIVIINEMQLYLNDQILFFWKILALLDTPQFLSY